MSRSGVGPETLFPTSPQIMLMMLDQECTLGSKGLEKGLQTFLKRTEYFRLESHTVSV